MAIPVILTPSSVLEYLQWQTFDFQPAAGNSPTFWLATPLPPGLTFDTATGQITGAAERPGVWDVILTAGNADGASDPQLFTIGILATSVLPPVDAVDLTIDLGTGEVTAGYPARRTVLRGKVQITPVFWVKRGDVRLFHIRFVKGGVVAALDLDTLALALLAYQGDAALVEASTFERVGTGEETYYRLAVTFTGTALDGELGSNQGAYLEEFAALGEFEWTLANELEPVTGPATLRSSTLNFDVGVAQDFVADV